MPTRLTEPAINAAIRSAKTDGRCELVDANQVGLRLRIGATGKATWVLACRDNEGRMRRFGLGSYPHMGVSDARRAADTQRAEIRKGGDPTAERRKQRALAKDAKDGIGTLEALLAHYGRKVGAKKKSWPESKRRIELVFAQHLKRPLPSLKRQELQFSIDSYEAEQQARGAATSLTPVLRWAEKRSFVEFDLTRLDPPAKSDVRKRVLSREELRALLPVLRGSSSPYAAALYLILLTITRREEVGGLTWRELDLDEGLWIIPAGRVKNKTAHEIPLSPQAVDHLRRLGPGRPGEYVFHTSKGGLLSNWDRGTKAVMAQSETTGWTRHDLRRTGATMIGRMGHPPHVVEAALNHVHLVSQVATTYNQARYRSDVEIALEDLGNALDRIERGGAEVVRLRAVAND